MKRLDEYGGDIRKFKIVKRHPSVLKQVGVSKTEPGDENNQDISALVGKVDIRKLETFAQDDPDAYSFSGGLCLANQGLLEFVEMFKAPIKVLHPLLTATQEGNFKGTEGFGAIPFDGIVLAHSNESEWKTFRNNKNNEAFLDRIYIVKVPYCLRVSEEIKIYEKLLRNSSLAEAKCAPGHAQDDEPVRDADAPEGARELVALFEDADLRRREPEGHRPARQELPGVPRLRRRRRGHERRLDALRVQDPVEGLQLRPGRDRRQPGAPDVRARAADRARAVPGRDSSRSTSASSRSTCRRATPSSSARRSRPPTSRATASTARTSSTATSPTPTTGSRTRSTATPTPARCSTASQLNAELEKIEKPAGISNPKDFRNEIVNFVLRARANNDGKNPLWTSYEKLRTVIEKKMFSNTEELLPVISFNAKASADEAKKHENFVNRMVEKGYTPKQVRLLCEWYLRVRKSS